MASEAIERILARKWFYRFRLPDDRVTDTYVGEKVLQFHADRLRMLNRVLDERFPDSLGEKTGLDLACHQGFYALKLAQRGLRRVVGVDVRQEHIDSANLIKSAFGLDDLVFRCQDVNDSSLRDFEPADLVLLLGLIYHLEDPIGVLRLARQLTKSTCIIETQIAAPTRKTEPEQQRRK